jgi:serine phosphatase RsbU (regulator of sigma subunit)/HAMP domain-containing protein
LRIRTQFVITMVLFGLTLSVIAVSLFVTSREVVRLDEQQGIAVDIGRGASELGYLVGDYVLHREDQQRVRWMAKWTSVSEQASRLSPASAEERAIARRLTSDLARLREVFEDVARTSGDPSQALVSVSWSRMAVQNAGLAFDSAILSKELHKREADVQQRNTLLIFTLVALFGAYFATNYVLVYRRALRSLADVQAGTEIIGQGNLDHTIPIDRDDEIGDLSRAFNKMTTDLKGVMASKSQLQEEIAVRVAAEEALQDSIVQIEELSEERLQELSITGKLLEAADEVAQWTDIEGLAKGLARILLKLTSHSRATVNSWNEERREIQVIASEGEMPCRVGTRWRFDALSAAARRAMSDRAPGVWDLDDLPEDERGIAAPEHDMRHALYVPLVQREDVVGMIVLDDPGERREFSEREIQLVGGIAAQAAVALENARLFEAQRSIADRLQEALLVLPDEMPGIEFAHVYHSATISTRVGGDFYDLFEVGCDQVGVVIGDVAGKGLDAAVLTSMVKNTIRAHANEKGKTPRQILKLTNDVVFKATRSETFVTVFFGILDCHDGRLVYSNAGHTPAAIVCSDGSAMKLLATGPLLGAFANAAFEEAEARLGSDGLLLLYTDGLTEARREGVFYGEERLFELLASTTNRGASALLSTVIEDVMSYTGNRLQDDLAILSVKRVE